MGKTLSSQCFSFSPVTNSRTQLDAGDPEHHFSSDVAGRASKYPLLLYACLAVSACHLSRTANTISPEVADSYHERCVSIMLPVLDKPEFEIGIDILLSSTVILRFFEQISCTPSLPAVTPIILRFLTDTATQPTHPPTTRNAISSPDQSISAPTWTARYPAVSPQPPSGSSLSKTFNSHLRTRNASG